MTAKKLILSSFVVLVLLGFPAYILAQTPTPSNFDATVSPTFIEISAKPGAAVNQTVRLRNNTAKPVTLNSEVKLMGADETGELTIKETKEDHISWIELKEKSVTLRPNEWLTVPFVIEIPESAAFGYYWALSFTSETEQRNETGAAISASIVVPVLLNVEKEGAKTEGKLLDFKTDAFWYEYPPMKFTNVFQNTGNVHIRPQGNIYIKDFLGREVAILEVNQSQGSVLPEVKRTFTSEWNDGFITYEPKMQDGEVVRDENGNEQREMKIHFQKLLDLRIGKYTATSLLLVSGQDRDYTYEKSLTFFVFPWKVVLVLIAIVIFVGIGLFTTGRSTFRKVRGVFRRK